MTEQAEYDARDVATVQEIFITGVGDSWRPFLRRLWTHHQRAVSRGEDRPIEPTEDEWRVIIAAFMIDPVGRSE